MIKKKTAEKEFASEPRRWKALLYSVPQQWHTDIKGALEQWYAGTCGSQSKYTLALRGLETDSFGPRTMTYWQVIKVNIRNMWLLQFSSLDMCHPMVSSYTMPAEYVPHALLHYRWQK